MAGRPSTWWSIRRCWWGLWFWPRRRWRGGGEGCRQWPNFPIRDSDRLTREGWRKVLEVLMPSRERVNEFIAVVESGDHAGAIERYYTEDASMQENAAPPRAGADVACLFQGDVLSGRRRPRRHSLDFRADGKVRQAA